MNKKLIIVFVIFTVIGLGLFYFLINGNIGTDYKTVVVKKEKINKEIQETGTVSSKNVRRVYGDGAKKILELPIKLGMPIEKGQMLVSYDNNLDLEIRKVEKQIEVLEAKYKDALSGEDIESINNARIEASKIRSQLELAKKNKERMEVLFNKGAVAETEFEESVSAMEDLEASLKIAQNSYNKLAKGISKNKRKEYEAEIDVLLVNLEILSKNKENYVVYSDIEGIVTALDTFEGDIPSAARLIIEIQDPSSKVLLIDFKVEDALKIEAGMDAKVNDRKLGISIDGLKVQKLYPRAFVVLSELSVEENRQTVEIGLSDEAFDLPFGIEIEAAVIIKSDKTALITLPETVIYKDGKSYVKLLDNGEIVDREIVTGVKTDSFIEVISGLSEGDEILLNYQED